MSQGFIQSTINLAASALTGTTLASNVVTSSLTTVGALNSGSITSGFGNIDNGSSTLDTGALTAATGSFDSGTVVITSTGRIDFSGQTSPRIVSGSIDFGILNTASSVNLLNITDAGVWTIGGTGDLTMAGDLTVSGTGTHQFSGRLRLSTVTTLANDATPTVAAGNLFITGGTTAITDFDDGVVGQTITILAAHSVTITDGAPIILAGGANYAMTDSDTLTLTMFNDQVWNEVARSVN